MDKELKITWWQVVVLLTGAIVPIVSLILAMWMNINSTMFNHNERLEDILRQYEHRITKLEDRKKG